ncbi:MAG: glycosyl hydrolase [Planctomycetota bacterium]|nr:glycosyl hydrolase [Planctomycetota bacterium]
MIRTVFLGVATLALVCLGGPATAEPPAAEADPAFAGLEWRCIGPARGGRVSSVAGVRGDRRTYYMGACGGGVWKTTDAGHSWKNVTDGFVKTGSVGAVAVAPSDANVLYVGMGEPDPRGNFSHGDGVYRSTDAGATWTHKGLGKTRQIGRIVVHPENPDLVYVAALGHVYGPNKERGVFRSTDGGATWTCVKFVSEDAGAVELAMCPFNPRVLYAGFWRMRRRPWRMDSGGEGSGLWRSTDGGDTWVELTKGLPKGVKGRIGVSASGAKRGRVYAIVEAEDGGVFRSDDGGDSWRRVNDKRKLRQRAWYYSRIEADPQDADTVYVLNVRFHKSVDGGKSFKAIPTPHVDNHALWIDPDDNQRMVEGNDGGANVSEDGGRTWSRQDNQPTAQFYRVTTDNRFPYRVLGSQQDNTTLSIAHTSTAKNGRDFHPVGGGESGYIAVHPENPDIVYGGSYAGWLTRYDHATGMVQPISPWPESAIGSGADVLKHRFQWTFPIVFSPHDPNVLYVGGEVLWRTTDEGRSWTAISPDLTTNDKAKQASSGGPITQDNTTVEYHCTIFTVAESPRRQGRIWVGTDDGRVHVTDDAGGAWADVTPKALDAESLVSLVEASPHDADTAWLAVNRYRSDDFTPHVFRTRDRGATWTRIVDGIAPDAFVRTVREDPVRKDLLYAGTETGVYVSFDGGGAWQPLQLNLPVVPITGLVVKDDDLVIATQGRSFWILPGLSRLRQRQADGAGEPLLAPAPAWRTLDGSARVHFEMPERIEGKARLSITTADAETVVRAYDLEYETEDGPKDGDEDKGGTGENVETHEEEGDADARTRRRGRRRETLRVRPGWNLFRWDLRRALPTTVPGAVGWPTLTRGPRVLPGRYVVRLVIDGKTWSKPLEVQTDPRRPLSEADRTAAGAYVDAVYATLDGVHRSVNKIRDVRRQLVATMRRARKAGKAKALEPAAKPLRESLREIEDALIQWRNKAPQDPLNFPPRLNDKLTMLLNLTNRDPRPTQGMRNVLAHLKAQAEQWEVELALALGELVPAFNAAVEEAKLPAVVVPKRKR